MQIRLTLSSVVRVLSYTAYMNDAEFISMDVTVAG